MSKELQDFFKNFGRPPAAKPKRIPAAKRRALRDSEPGFQFRIDLLGAKPPIWRRIVVPAGADLGQLHFLANPKHPEHEEFKEWVGDGFDPEHFDLDDHNAALALIPKR